MKFPRRLLHTVVEIRWKDPATLRGEAVDKPLHGRKGLGTWQVWGVAESVIAGVVRIVHAAGYNPDVADPDEFDVTNIPESLIEAVWGFPKRTRVRQ